MPFGLKGARHVNWPRVSLSYYSSKRNVWIDARFCCYFQAGVNLNLFFIIEARKQSLKSANNPNNQFLQLSRGYNKNTRGVRWNLKAEKQSVMQLNSSPNFCKLSLEKRGCCRIENRNFRLQLHENSIFCRKALKSHRMSEFSLAKSMRPLNDNFYTLRIKKSTFANVIRQKLQCFTIDRRNAGHSAPKMSYK